MKSLMMATLLVAGVALADDTRDKGRYEPRFRDPVIEELRQREEQRVEQADEATAKIRKQQKQRKERERKEEKSLVASLPAAAVPAGPKAFKQLPHLKPAAQYMTGTCWSFSTTSLLESEVQRTRGKKIKLSEMFTVYHEYLEKLARYVRERGDSELSEGSEPNAVTRIFKLYGAVPHAAYPGVPAKDGRHDHQRLSDDFAALAKHVKQHDLWDEGVALQMARAILDRELGKPPARFAFEGKRYTPKTFLKQALRLDPDDYVSIMSTSSEPFYARGVLDVADNWWRDDSYHNVPLDEFYKAFQGSMTRGYSIIIAVDVSEPGKDSLNDAMFVPTFDIPAAYIDQDAREYRTLHEVTTDDHGVHVVGHVKHAGHDWYLVKDSGRASRRGKHKGYFFVRADYIRLKVMAFMVHRDAVPELLARFAAPGSKTRTR